VDATRLVPNSFLQLVHLDRRQDAESLLSLAHKMSGRKYEFHLLTNENVQANFGGAD